jgi:F-type H+-transporting ATPase subunit gamma
MIINLNKFKKIVKKSIELIFLFFLIILTIVSTKFYNDKKIIITENYKSTINNIYFEKTIDYIFEPDQEEILKDLIPSSLKIQLYKALLDSFASEHGARMTAMHKATDNANEMKNDLKLFYNKARQAAITNEILEIVAGAEALGG